MNLKTEVIKKAMSDETFRKALMADAKTAVQNAFDVVLPENYNLKVVTESADTGYIVMPSVKEENSKSQAHWN